MRKGILRDANSQVEKGWGYEPTVLIGETEAQPKGTLADVNFVSEMIKQEISDAQETTDTTIDDIEKTIDDIEKTIAAALNDLDSRIKNINV